MAGQQKTKIAFIGCGGIHWGHLEGYQSIADQCEIVACVDSRQAQAQASAEKAGGAQVFTDWNEMLEKVEVDAVDICLPHHLHKTAIVDCAQAGKHIICEKPLCLTLDEADEIIQTVRQNKITYMSAHNQLFMPVVAKIKEMLDQGLLGEVYTVKTQDSFVAKGFLNGRQAMGWRGDLATQGGGELIDTGYHPSYLLLYLVGAPIQEVQAATTTFRLDMEAEDTAFVNVKFSNGVIGQIATSWALPMPVGAHRIHCIGSNGQLYGGGNQLYFLPDGFRDPAYQEFPAVNTLAEECRYFVKCLREKTEPLATLQQGRDVLELILKATTPA